MNAAGELGLPRLVFVLDDEAVLPLPGKFLSDPEYGHRQARFRERVRTAGPTVAMVSSPDRLETLVFQALTDLRRQATGITSVDGSAYLEQVRQIVPVQLYDRDRELAELAAFCTEPGAEARICGGGHQPGRVSPRCCRGSVLHPPPNVQKQWYRSSSPLATRAKIIETAFADAVLQQLPGLLGGEANPGVLD